jgi:hypothetical protein
MLTGDDLLKKVQSLETHKSVVPVELAKFLSQEVCKDLDYNEIYKLAEEAMSRRFMRKNTIASLCEEYGERYDYVFLDNDIDPAL